MFASRVRTPVRVLVTLAGLFALTSSTAPRTVRDETVPRLDVSTHAPVAPPNIDGATLARLTWVAPTHVWLRLPRGCVQNGTRASWTQSELGVELTVDESSDDFSDSEALAEHVRIRRRKVVERTDVRVAGVDGTSLVLAPLLASEEVQSRLVFARRGGLQLTLLFEAPRGRASSVFDEFVAEVLRDSVWDLNVLPVPLAGFPWSVRLSADLSFLTAHPGGARFAAQENGAEAAGAASKAILLSIQHLQPRPEIANDSVAGGWRRATPREAAERLLESCSQRRVFEVGRPSESRALTVDGREAWEMVARANTPTGSRPTRVYLAVVVADEYEVTFSAFMREDVAAVWLPRCRALVRSWKQSLSATAATPK